MYWASGCLHGPHHIMKEAHPRLGNKANTVTIEADLAENTSGVLYALGSGSGGLTCFLDGGHLCYEYNLFIVPRTKIRSTEPLPAGRSTITVETRYKVPQPGGSLTNTMKVDGTVVAEGDVPISAPLLFTANDCFDIGTCLGSPVSLDYYDRARFPFDGIIHRLHVRYGVLV